MSFDWATLSDFVFVGVLGALVGMGELISRYRDDPWDTLQRKPGLVYVGLNTFVSIAALILIRGFGWTFGANSDSVRWTQVLVAGFGAMALFRSSLFTVRISDQDVPVGPNSFLQIVLAAADREVDRRRATIRAERAKTIMKDVSFDNAMVSLPAFCIALMQNLPPNDQAELQEDVDKLAAADVIDAEIKSFLLGAALMNYVGEDVLKAAVASLDDHIHSPAQPAEGANGVDASLE
ncbi:MAG: hypothetical protein U9Q82_07400 [Chloroflexota bacterium]|nr:hypothetical protein [Chloroflexota bacterium]